MTNKNIRLDFFESIRILSIFQFSDFFSKWFLKKERYLDLITFYFSLLKILLDNCVRRSVANFFSPPIDIDSNWRTEERDLTSDTSRSNSIKLQKKNISYSSAKAINATDYFWSIHSFYNIIYFTYINLEFFRNYSLWQRKSSFHRHRVIDVRETQFSHGVRSNNDGRFPLAPLSSTLYLIARFTLSLDRVLVWNGGDVSAQRAKKE